MKGRGDKPLLPHVKISFSIQLHPEWKSYQRKLPHQPSIQSNFNQSVLLEPVGISPQQPPTCCTWVLRKSHIKPACHQSRGLLLCNLMTWASWHQWQGPEELKWKYEYKPPCLGRCVHTRKAIGPSLKGSVQDWGLFLSCSRPKGDSEGWQQLPLPCKPSQLTWPCIPAHVRALRVGRGDVLSPACVTSSQAWLFHHGQVECLERPSLLSAALTQGQVAVSSHATSPAGTSPPCLSQLDCGWAIQNQTGELCHSLPFLKTRKMH